MQGFQPNNPIIPLNIAVKYDPPIIAIFYRRNKTSKKKHMYSIVLNDLVNLNDSFKISKKLYQEHSLYINENIIQFEQLQENVEKLLNYLRNEENQDDTQQNYNSENTTDQKQQNQQEDDDYYDFEYDDYDNQNQDNNMQNMNMGQNNNNNYNNNMQNMVDNNQIHPIEIQNMVQSPQNIQKNKKQMPTLANKSKKKPIQFLSQNKQLQQQKELEQQIQQQEEDQESEYYEVSEDNIQQHQLKQKIPQNLDDEQEESDEIENRDYGNYEQHFSNNNKYDKVQDIDENLDDYYDENKQQFIQDNNNVNIMDNQGFVFDNNNNNNNNNNLDNNNLDQAFNSEIQPGMEYGQDYQEDKSYNYDNSEIQDDQQPEEQMSYEPTVPQGSLRKSRLGLGLLRDLSNQRENQNNY